MLALILWSLLALIVGAIVALVIYARWHYGTLEKLGIPVVKPHFLLGSDPDGHLVVMQERDYERYKRYGPVFGVYEGRKPRIYICDPEMIRLIMIKDFDSFHDRTPMVLGHEIFDSIIELLPGEKWKTVKSEITPAFTTSRIKQSTELIQTLMEEYARDLNKSFTGSRTDFNMHKFFTTVMVDLTAKVFLGVELPDRKDPENYLVQLVKAIISEDMESNFLFTLVGAFPFLIKFIPPIPQQGLHQFLKTLSEIVKTRRESGETPNDFLATIIKMLDKVNTEEYKRLGITETVVHAQALEMFIAGYDNVSTSINILTYYLASHPQVQEKLLNEIDNVMEKHGGKITYDSIEELNYLAACAKEAIRLSPGFPRNERCCAKDWTYKGLTVKKGMSVMIPAWATNRNADAFPDPQSFIPERWEKMTPDINQYCFTSFGFGPHGCIGMRLTYIIIKVVMCRLMRDFRFELRDDTSVEMFKGFAMITRYKPIKLDLVRRAEE